jgi:WD40 repeat protein/DNA-binding SARP family transcriptional activator
VEFSVLGPLRVTDEHGPVEIAGLKERILLARLVASAGQLVTTDELVDSLWGDAPPRTAAKSLQTYVLRLRNALEPDRHGSPRLLVTEGPGYRLAVPDEAVDARRFARLADLGGRAYRAGRAAAATATLREALGLWRGPAYAGFESARFGGGESRRLDELRLIALEDRIGADLDLGRARETVPEIESLVHEHRLRERLWYLLVLALYRAGRQADALAAYARARALLIGELGVEPGEQLRGLHRRVLAQDDRLLVRDIAPTVPAALQPQPGLFVGRDPELAALRDAWTRCAGGEPVTVLLQGPRGAGRRRLAVEFALAVAERGYPVTYHADGPIPCQPPETQTLTVVTTAVAEASSRPSAGARLTVVLGIPSTPVPGGSEVLELRPLPPMAVREIVATYLDESAVDEALPGVLREAGGLPGRVHDAAMELARRHAAVRVGAAAARTGQMQVALHAARDDLRGGVAEFREAVERRAPPVTDACPWKGLAAYDVDDAPWFAGRERLVAELLTRLPAASLLAVVGASGSGKSSLVRAGLLASLRAGALPGSDSWVQLAMRPGPQPMRELVRVSLRGADPDRDRVADLLRRMVYDDRGAGRTVLVVDQLEEAWTSCDDAGQRAAFLAALAEIVKSEASRCTVVLVVRADYVAELADQPVLARALADATVLVGAPGEAEVRRAVQHPAERAGLHLDVGLADALVADAGHEPGALPLLSTALTELWEQRDGRRLTLSAYVAAAGIRGAVARIAERAYGALDPADQAAARILLLRLASSGEGDAVTRRRVPLVELEALPDPRVRATVDPLAQARLLSVSAGHVEVAHEALFREWPRLRGWLEEDAAGRAVQRRLALAAGEWEAGGREATELWRGTRLAAATDFAAAHPGELTAVERTFLAAGQAQQEADRYAAEQRAAAATRQNRRLRWLLGGVALLLVVAMVAGIAAAQAGVRAARETETATARELAAAAVANLELDPQRSILLALEAVEQARSLAGPVRWQAEEALHRAVTASRVVLIVAGVGGMVDWSPDGSVFATEGPENSGVVDVRDATTGERVRSWQGHTADINDIAFSPDGSRLVTTGDDGAARVWDPATGKELLTVRGEPEGQVWGPSFSQDGSLLAASWVDESVVRLVDLVTGRTVREITGFASPYVTSFSPDGERLAISALGEPVAIVMGVDAGHGPDRRFVLRGHEWGISDLAWSPDGAWIATSSDDLTARIWDATTGEPRFVLAGHAGFVFSVDWSPDSSRLVTGSADGTARVWGITDSGTRELLTLSGQDTRAGLRVAFSPDGNQVLTGDRGIAAATIWDVTPAAPAEWATVPGDAVGYGGLDFAPDGRLVASRGSGQTSVWDPRTGGELATIGRSGDHVIAVDVSPDGRLIATAGFEAPVRVWDAATKQEVFTGHGREDVAWSPDGTLLAMASAGGATAIVDRSGNLVTTLPDAPELTATIVRFSPDGRLLAVASEPTNWRDLTTATVHVWDWERGEVVRTISTWADNLAFDPTGRRIATSHHDGYAEIWDLASPRRLATLPSHSGSAASIAFSPDGSRIATTGADGVVRLWDAGTAVQTMALTGHAEMVWDAAFSPDGSMLASASPDGTVRVWAIDLDDLVDIANRKLVRTLTDDECRQYLHLPRCR